MSDIKSFFVTKKNFDLLLSNIQKELSAEYSINVQKTDPEFIDLVDKIATTVFTHEKKNFKDKPVENSLYVINKIIINEVIKYLVLKNKNLKNSSIVEETASSINDANYNVDTGENGNDKPSDKTDNINPPEKIIEEDFDIFLEQEETVFNSPIYNVKKINVKGVNMFNGEYSINSKNDKLVFKEKNEEELIEILIDHGDYSNHSLLKEIEYCLKEASINKFNYEVYLEENTNKVVISLERIYELQKSKNNTFLTFKELKNKITKNNEKVELHLSDKSSNVNVNFFTIEKKNSTLLKVLGFEKNDDSSLTDKSIMIAENPLKLKKPNKLEMNITFYDDSLEKIVDCDKTFIFDYSKINDNVFYPINFFKDFFHPVSIKKITLDFKGYNHRGLPYFINTNITQKQLT